MAVSEFKPRLVKPSEALVDGLAEGLRTPETNLKQEITKHKGTQIIKPRCEWCNKIVDVVAVDKIADPDGTNNQSYLTLACGHTLIQDVLEEVELDFFDSFMSYRNETLLPFQKVGAKFGVSANARCLIADDMGLGKTPQSMAIMKMLNLIPCLQITKASLIDQWAHQNYNWCGEDFALVRVIREPRFDKPWPKVCPVTVISYDALIRCKWFGTFDKDGVYHLNEENFPIDSSSGLHTSPFKLMIIDETQQIKNRNSKRALAVKALSVSIPHIIGLSGTPIKNNASEYFSILNILQPNLFNNFARYTYRYVDTIKTTQYGPKYGGIQEAKLTAFHEDTKTFIIRRTQEEVMPELPKIWRQYQYYELGPEVKDAYVKKVKQYQEDYGRDKTINVITYLNDMRYLTGLAKIDPVVDYVTDFLENNPPENGDAGKKITVFTHHHDAAKLIHDKLCREIDKINKEIEDESKKINHPILTLNEESKFDAVEKFRTDKRNRIFIGTTLACGEGLNMQFCHHAVLVEREWNPANEEQAEKRFSRIGIEAGISSISVLYPTALGTIDEFFADLVEKKRAWMKATLDGEIVDYQESNIIRELAEMLADKGLEHWSINV